MKTSTAISFRSGSRLVAASGIVLAMALGACTPGSSGAPASIALPSVNISPLASAATQAALAALDQVDAAITANGTSAGLTADEQTSLKTLSTDIRTKLQTGDMPSARTAFTAFSAKVDELAAKLNTAAGTQLKSAVAALGTLLPAS